VVEEQWNVMELQGSYAVQENQYDAGYAPDYVQLADGVEEM
jgi:hypothetical protein